MACFHLAGVTCQECRTDVAYSTSDGTSSGALNFLNPAQHYAKQTVCELEDCACCVQGYSQGRKDAIDEVLVLIKSVEATLICEAEWTEWLEGKLEGGKA